MAIKIILADDHVVLRKGLRSLLEQQDNFEVIGEAQDGREAVKLVRDLEPDIAILDIGMPNINGILAAEHIASESPKTKILALSMHSDRRFVAKMLQAGAKGYLLKDCAFEELVDAVNTILSGEMYLSEKISGLIINDYISKIDSIHNLGDRSHLTKREKEILQMIAEGNNTTEIGKYLSVSVKTVETHRKNIMDKLNIHNIADLTKYAVREGLTSLGD